MPGFPVSYDLALTADEQDFNIPDPQSPQGICDSIRVAASIIATTWRYDLEKGIPYLDDQLMKPANEALLRAIWYDLLINTPGVVRVGRLALTFAPAQRKMFIDFKVYNAAGQLAAENLPLQLQ